MLRHPAILIALVALVTLLGLPRAPRRLRRAVPAFALAGDAADARPLVSPVAAARCDSGPHVDELAACLENGAGPDDCLARLEGPPLCDADGDGLGDDLEDALALAYGPVFAMNGGRFGGVPESVWPANIEHFLSRARLVHRPDGTAEALLDPAPRAASIGQATVRSDDGRALLASDPLEGSDFWLCLNDASAAARVSDARAMRSLPGGVDLEVVAHPANGALSDSRHLLVAFSLFWSYNLHSYVDDHEGDRETVALLVDRRTGAVDAAQFDRHPSLDETKLVDAKTFGARDPRRERHFGDLSSSEPTVHGLRFADYEGARHHVVAYLAAGGHAPYDYPGNTFILWQGPRDEHGGDGAKLFTWTGELGADWEGPRERVRVNRHNPGEPNRILLPWARFRGQWGCHDEPIAQSWPGPFGNARHPRPVFERRWEAQLRK
jgi:hypothetical protein